MLPVPLPLPHPSEAAAAAAAVVVVLSLLLIDGRGSLLVLPHALHASMTTGATWLLLGLLTLLSATTTCDASCYFSLDLQGDYLMQSSPINSGSPVQYSQVIITAEAISIWGLCHRRIGSNVVLKDSLGALHSSGTPECFRCFTLQPRSRNVIELLAESLDKCYMTEEVAQSNCPDERSKNRSFSRIILYKTKDLIGTEIRPEYCPINGRFTFIYNRNDDLENKLECRTPMSELDNCPSGAELNLHFRQCLSEHFDMTFQCLGHWSTTGNQAYLALLDIKAPVEKQPKYRCAMFRENPVTGSIQIAFSRDSTCTTDLSSAISGYETVILTPIPSNGWPDAAYAAKCRFPEWAEGKWQHVTVENNTLTYIDHEKFKTYTLRCLDTAPNPERYYVFARTQCGEELYTCIWMKYRGVNVFEFQIGSYSSGILNSSLCSDYNFRDTTWITQGRTKRFKEIPCPIRGEYTGIIPDAESPKLCAKLSSDCKAPEIMYYTVSECDISQVYEEREYRCLGQWEENGRLYTFTQRRDATSYECFVGSKNNEINIKEAGEHCDRRIDPLQEGMKLNRIGSCHESENNAHTERTIPTRPSPNITRMTPRPTFQPTKPWKPITAPPKVINRHNSACHLAISPRLILVLSYIIYLLSV